MLRSRLSPVVLAMALASCQRGQTITQQPIDLGSAPIHLSMEGMGKS